MPLFMDTHSIPGGLTFDDVAGAHRADLNVQHEFDVSYLRFWVDETLGKVFCLVEAPSAEAAIAVHRQAHGLMPDEIFEVQEGV